MKTLLMKMIFLFLWALLLYLIIKSKSIIFENCFNIQFGRFVNSQVFVYFEILYLGLAPFAIGYLLKRINNYIISTIFILLYLLILYIHYKVYECYSVL